MMPARAFDDEDEWDDEPDWHEETPGEGSEDLTDDLDDVEPIIACPYCGEEVHEDSPRCPYCENYLSLEDQRRSPKPWWFVLGVGLGLLVFLRWLFV